MLVNIVLELLTKSGSHLPGPIHLKASYVPRVGEIIDAHQFLGMETDQVGNFIILSVVHKMTLDGFLPVISAQQWYKGLRYQVLEDYGWLTPVSEEPSTLSHDEDLYNSINI